MRSELSSADLQRCRGPNNDAIPNGVRENEEAVRGGDPDQGQPVTTQLVILTESLARVRNGKRRIFLGDALPMIRDLATTQNIHI